MPIYSKTRSGFSFSESNVAVGKYGVGDSARILYESCINDKRLFDAMIAHDRNEIKAIREGTILEAGSSDGLKADFKALGTAIKEFCLGIWNKIVQFIDSTIEKITNFALGNGKKCYEKYLKTLKEYGDRDGINKITISNGKFPDFDYEINALKMIETAQAVIDNEFNADEADKEEAFKDNIKEYNKTEIISAALGRVVGHDNISQEEFTSLIVNEAFLIGENADIHNKRIKETAEFIGNGLGTIIKEIKEVKSQSKKYIDNVIKSVEDDFKKADSLDKNNKKEISDKVSSYIKDYAYINTAVINTITKACIKAQTARFMAGHRIISALVAKIKEAYKNDSNSESVQEACLRALVEAAIEEEEVFNSDEPADQEVKDYIDSIELENV